MPSTTNLQMPYPALSSAPNVPQDMQALAQQIESKFAGAWTPLTIASGYQNWTGTSGPAPQYRFVGTKVQVLFWIQKTSGTFALGTDVIPFAAGALPAAARPATRNVLRWGHSTWTNSVAPMVYITVKPDGSITVNPAQTGSPVAWVMGDFEFEPGL